MNDDLWIGIGYTPLLCDFRIELKSDLKWNDDLWIGIGYTPLLCDFRIELKLIQNPQEVNEFCNLYKSICSC